MLKLRIALLARLMGLAVVIEPIDCTPRSISRRLTGLRIETSGKGVVFCQCCAIALQIVPVDPMSVHPQAQAFVTDELRHPYRLLNGGVLCLVAVQLILVDQHVRSLLVFEVSVVLMDCLSVSCCCKRTSSCWVSRSMTWTILSPVIAAIKRNRLCVIFHMRVVW